MDALRRSRWCLVVCMAAVALVAACTSGRPRPLHYGSLVADDRILDYAHPVETLKLQNGLLVALVPDERANLVAVDVRYLVGDIEDPEGKRGLAHVVEHMMFEQRSGPGEPTTAERLATIALRHNATTSWDATHYHTLALASQLDELLAVEASRMRNGCAGLDEATFKHELAVVAQELTQRGTTELVDVALGTLYGARHGYTRRSTTADLARLTLADVCSFVDAHYGPDRAILVIAGQIG
ncbi:MAG: insulinase family protein, partial [Deltaproteobacteria bacterium]|nr:insulinase family protein [Nannocystaceae bacterium]